uniref:Uncharacterized protein n=1 Tax=Fagus sylvatica TaxID=28930 RepID=A0A2N9FZ87_FAGSY
MSESVIEGYLREFFERLTKIEEAQKRNSRMEDEERRNEEEKAKAVIERNKEFIESFKEKMKLMQKALQKTQGVDDYLTTMGAYLEGEKEAHSTSWYVEDITKIEEARHLTGGGRHFKPAYLEEDYLGRDPPHAREANKAKALKETKEDRVLAQLKKTQASILIWRLIMASQKHRDAILEALARKEVPMDTTPEQVLSIMGMTTDEFAIIFTTKDLPPKGGDHNRALYVTIDCLGSKVPKMLVDNGSSINVCPMRTATKIRLTKGQLSPSSLTVRAYDESIRGVIGTFEAECQIGPVSSSVLFHVLEITTSYNLLLGRGWMHPIGNVPSMVHQKFKLPWKGGVLTILGDGEINAAVIQRRNGRDAQEQATLNENFVKPGEDFPYCGFPEPRGGKPGFEIFFKAQLTLEDKASMEDKEWMKQMDPKAMKMFVQEGSVFHVEEELKEDPVAMIMPLDGSTSIWSFKNNFLDVVFNSFESISRVSNYPVNEMNLNFDYMHVFSGNEALNIESILNDEHLINEEDEAKIKPIENETLKINLGTLENPKKFKIGSTLLPEKQEELTRLLKEFPEVFAWLYEDMPGIDPDIVQHRIPTLLEIKPVKQKLCRMKLKWMLKIKEEVIKQLKAGFIKNGRSTFGLKNVDATYQRMATALLHDMIHKEVEVYMEYMIVKSVTKGEHITNLRKFFERIKKYKLRLNLNKCTFRVTAGRLLGHMVSSRGIEVDPIKIKAILEIPPPKTEKEIRGFLGRLQYISRFIARLTTTCEPIFKLLKKGESKEWTKNCQKVFEAVKEYLSNPPVLAPPKLRRPLNLYLSVIEDALGSMLAQKDEDKKEHAIYYLSKRLKDYETRYIAIKKSCFALVWAVQKLRHILLAHQVLVVARMDTLKYLFKKPALTGKLSRQLILLAKFDLTYVAKNTIKGRVIVEHCAGHPVGEDDLDDDFPDEDVLNIEEKTTWKIYFDGDSNQHGYGVGVLLIAPDRVHIPLSAKLNFVATNNVAEYKACTVGLEALLAIDVKEVEIYGNSGLVLAQAQRIWKMKEEHLKPYQAYLE